MAATPGRNEMQNLRHEGGIPLDYPPTRGKFELVSTRHPPQETNIMTEHIIFDYGTEGCYAKGSLGHAHVRHVLARLVQSVNPAAIALIDSLEAAAPNGVADEYQALLTLQNVTATNLVWLFGAGDLMLERKC